MSTRASLRPWPRFRTAAHRPATNTEYFTIDTNDAPEAGRPTPLAEVRPLCGVARHGGIGYELVLATAMPQLGVEEDVRGAVGTRLMRAFRQAVAEVEEAARPPRVRVLLEGEQDQEEEEEEEEESAEDTLLFLLPPPEQLPRWRWNSGHLARRIRGCGADGRTPEYPHRAR